MQRFCCASQSGKVCEMGAEPSRFVFPNSSPDSLNGLDKRHRLKKNQRVHPVLSSRDAGSRTKTFDRMPSGMPPTSRVFNGAIRVTQNRGVLCPAFDVDQSSRRRGCIPKGNGGRKAQNHFRLWRASIAISAAPQDPRAGRFSPAMVRKLACRVAMSKRGGKRSCLLHRRSRPSNFSRFLGVGIETHRNNRPATEFCGTCGKKRCFAPRTSGRFEKAPARF